MEATSTHSDYKRVREDLELLQDDMAKLTKKFAETQRDNVSEFGNDLRRESEQFLGNARHQGDRVISRARHAGGRAFHNVEQGMEERPFVSASVFFLAGVLVGTAGALICSTRPPGRL